MDHSRDRLEENNIVEEVKSSFYAEATILYIENPKDST